MYLQFLFYVRMMCALIPYKYTTFLFKIRPGYVVYIVASSPPGTEEMGAMGREIESR
jgi:hypothetical protein